MSKGPKHARGTVVQYRGHGGLQWLAWAGYDADYEPVWYCQRPDSVMPGPPRVEPALTFHEEIGGQLIYLIVGEQA